MPRPNIHPEWYANAKVFCDGQLIMKVGSTKSRLKVDIWSKTHPFYNGSKKRNADSRLKRYARKYGMGLWSLKMLEPNTMCLRR